MARLGHVLTGKYRLIADQAHLLSTRHDRGPSIGPGDSHVTRASRTRVARYHEDVGAASTSESSLGWTTVDGPSDGQIPTGISPVKGIAPRTRTLARGPSRSRGGPALPGAAFRGRPRPQRSPPASTCRCTSPTPTGAQSRW